MRIIEDVDDSIIVDPPVEEVSERSETDIADLFSTAVKHEWDAIEEYRNILTTLSELGRDDLSENINDILKEENKHVGQLQTVLELVAPHTENIEKGQEEAQKALDGDENADTEDSEAEDKPEVEKEDKSEMESEDSEQLSFDDVPEDYSPKFDEIVDDESVEDDDVDESMEDQHQQKDFCPECNVRMVIDEYGQLRCPECGKLYDEEDI